MRNIVAQFIPIVIIYFLLSCSEYFSDIANTVLGKLLAILIIVYYTTIDKKLGLLVCSLTIWYYQSNMFENMLNMDEVMSSMFNNNTKEKDDEKEKVEGMENMECSKNKSLSTKETMSNLENIYKSENKVQESFAHMQNKDNYPNEFRKEYCDGNILKYKDMNVRGDMIEHVFPDLKYEDDKCNPCSETCDFSMEKRIKVEDEMKPKFSKEEK